MPFHRPSKKRIRTLCAEVSPEDGTDPRDWLKGLHGPKSHDTKALRLCGQVLEILSLQLAAEADDILNDLEVVGVEPVSNTKQLLVTVRPSGNSADPSRILEALGRASSRLRCEVASAITRRRAPLLTYRVVIEVTRG